MQERQAFLIQVKFWFKKCYEAGIKVTSLPGPVACITALTMSGLSTRRFAFEAFLPADKKQRAQILRNYRMRQELLFFMKHSSPRKDA